MTPLQASQATTRTCIETIFRCVFSFAKPISMADNSNDNTKAPTHTAFAKKREGGRLKLWRMIEVGAARLESDTRVCHVFLDRLPVGGFDGYLYLAPIGSPPPAPNPQPQRPGEGEDEE